MAGCSQVDDCTHHVGGGGVWCVHRTATSPVYLFCKKLAILNEQQKVHFAHVGDIDCHYGRDKFCHPDARWHNPLKDYM